MSDDELAAFITDNPLGWRIWMTGYEAGLKQGHQDERVSTEDLADLTARRIMNLQYCEGEIRKNTQKILSMEQVMKARELNIVGTYTGGAVPWE